ncbi:MAG: DEAD/DEAH box helicase [Phycisphaerae bacterium]|nr:DEAD/DEAH box helicase [Phycisphaerae bacterium]
MLVLHAVWTKGALHCWAEDTDAARASVALQSPTRASAKDTENENGHNGNGQSNGAPAHPFAASADEVKAALIGAGLASADDFGESTSLAATLPFWLPPGSPDGSSAAPLPSDRAADLIGLDDDARLEAYPAACSMPAVAVRVERSLALLANLDAARHEGSLGAATPIALAHDIAYWTTVARVATDLLADQRFIPSLVQERAGSVRAAWVPWLADQKTSQQLAALLDSMPAACRCINDEARGVPWTILESALVRMTDAFVRSVLQAESYAEAIEDRDPVGDPHVAWLSGLLDREDAVRGQNSSDTALMRGARAWIAQLDDVSEGRLVRLCLELSEPELANETPEAAMAAKWRLRFKLVTTDDPPVFIEAEQIWEQGASALKGLLAGLGKDGEEASDVLLGELGRASRIWPRIEKALDESAPVGLDLSTSEAYQFLREYRPILAEAGFEVLVPSWWGQVGSRLGARLLIDSEPTDAFASQSASGAVARKSELGLNSLVNYTWQIALGEQPMTLDAFRDLAASGSPLLKVNGRWVEIRPEDLQGASKFLADHPGGQMTLLEALRLAHGLEGATGSLPILGLDSTGWVSELLRSGVGSEKLTMITQPELFRGQLRPYQLAGLSWLAFLDKFGLGACLADDMGLGKTIQLIALLQHEREGHTDKVGPSLLVAPMSVVGNWARELGRFAPELKVMVHHGLERLTGEQFERAALASDVAITTYALVTRDKESLSRVHWRRVVLDEAQHIKNPPTKQTAAIRSLRCSHRIALTGTPVENRLSELWSIMEFCSPGYLGAQADFRRRFAVPIERHRDRRQADRLRSLVRPFVLRRLKTDPTVITDLPPLVESRQSVPLTPEQAQLYDSVVNDMLQRVDMAEGIRRRGLVLSALVKLKQICNHPAHFLKESANAPDPAKVEAATTSGGDSDGDDSAITPLAEADTNTATPLSARSGKATRLIDMLEEILAAGDRVLIFTQYRQMGHLLVSMIRRELDTEALFLHGGTPQGRREQLVDRFQSEDPTAPIFVLSLKAGGVGLNLTAANHVFHYDRWWNPAVENQATDRAFRIGQKRTVNVHKMISAGTLEERIDQMIEQKTELAAQIIGSGESWLTELSTHQLRDLLTLRRTSMEEPA